MSQDWPTYSLSHSKTEVCLAYSQVDRQAPIWWNLEELLWTLAKMANSGIAKPYFPFPLISVKMHILSITEIIIYSIYFPPFYGFYWYTTLFRLGSPISQANFFCICVYIDAIQTMILHFPCQLPLCISHIMNLFKQKSSSLGTFLSHLFLPCCIQPKSHFKATL